MIYCSTMHAVTSHRDACRKFATIRVHSLGFYQLVYRLVATGQKVATVARGVNAHGKVSYRLSEKFGEGGTPA